MSVKNNRWSNPFSLEAVGTTGMIQCKDDNRTYNVTIIQIQINFWLNMFKLKNLFF